jgi:multimeric flavodoxin WrbA
VAQQRLLIAWHSQTGAARKLAEAVYRGARTAQTIELVSAHASTLNSADLLAADAYIFVTPEYLGTMAGVMKDLFDRSYYDLLERCNGRGYAACISAGSAGHGALAQLERIATGLRLQRLAEPLIVNTQAQTPAAILAPKQLSDAQQEAARTLGATVAWRLQEGI